MEETHTDGLRQKCPNAMAAVQGELCPLTVQAMHRVSVHLSGRSGAVVQLTPWCTCRRLARLAAIAVRSSGAFLISGCPRS